MKNLVFSHDYFLTAGECNARGEMPVTLMADKLIEVATNHANHLGIGYADLSPHGVGWVLSRMGVEMIKTPGINATYRLSTWIEGWSRAYSERCFRFDDSDGNPIGWGRTIWAIIDFKTRRAVDLMQYGTPDMIAPDMECPMERLRKHPQVVANRMEDLKFKFMDLDFNRHVNSVRYIEHILNLWPLSHYDKYRIDRFDIAYRHECLAGQTVQLAVDDRQNDMASVDILRDGERVVTSAVHFIEDPI